MVCKVTFWGASDTWQSGGAGMGWDLVEWEERYCMYVCRFGIITQLQVQSCPKGVNSLVLLHLSSVCFIELVCIPECIHQVQDAP